VELVAEALRLRVDDYRSKPVCVSDLRAAVDRLVGPAILPADLAASIQRVLDREFAKPVQFDDLAGQFGISEAHLRRLFRTVHGKTPRRYVIETRLQHAATLLRTTAHRVEYIAAEVGYPTSTLFDRAFRAFFGTTPSEYRTRMRE
jgi:transcriptional regulator GlxA family with amidase domain